MIGIGTTGKHGNAGTEMGTGMETGTETGQDSKFGSQY